MATYVDTHQLQAARARLAHAPAAYSDAAADVIASGARHIQTGMKTDATGHRYLPKFAGTIGRSRLTKLSWEVGFNRRGQGLLANIIVGGSINNAPVYPWLGPLEREIPLLEQRLADQAEQTVADCFG
ncbi:MAG: hypothetical protein H6515_14290 [Microthrixaceae bacterium]|nr:hypothetical protein [Microthrixaceae bacterium]